MNLKRAALVAVALAVGISPSLAQLVNGRLVTSFYTWQGFDTVSTSTTYLRAYQTVQLTASQGDVSLTTFLQGAMNGAGSFGDNGRVRLYNLYLSWRNIGRAVDLQLGRQAVFAGAGVGTMDGLRAKVHLLDDRVCVTGYGGATVADDFGGIRNNIHDNHMMGGQVVTTAVPDARIGLSYMNRLEARDPYYALRARDTSFLPYPIYIANSAESEQYGSADAYYTYGTRLSAYGRYDYDFNQEKTSRGQGSLRFHATDVLTLTADYVYRAPRIPYNSIFWVFASNSVSEMEGGVEYAFAPRLLGFARYAGVSYADDHSHRWTLGMNTGYGSVSYSGSDGYAGQLQSFNVQAAYPLMNSMLVPTLGVSYASYRLEEQSSRDNALAILAGAIVRPVRSFSVDVQGQWMTNAVYKHDARLQLRLMYWFAQRLSLFGQEVER